MRRTKIETIPRQRTNNTVNTSAESSACGSGIRCWLIAGTTFVLKRGQLWSSEPFVAHLARGMTDEDTFIIIVSLFVDQNYKDSSGRTSWQITHFAARFIVSQLLGSNDEMTNQISQPMSHKTQFVALHHRLLLFQPVEHQRCLCVVQIKCQISMLWLHHRATLNVLCLSLHFPRAALDI